MTAQKHKYHPLLFLVVVVFMSLSSCTQKVIRLSKAKNTVTKDQPYIIKNKKDAVSFSRIYNLSELESLDIRYYDEDVMANLNKCSSLKRLWLRKLDLEFVPDVIFELKELELLSLQENPIKTLPKGICACTKLNELILWDTEIHRFPSCIEDLPLRRVDLYGVQMNYFDQIALREFLPKAKLELEAPCDCEFDD